jgi:2',3'-cyclic-nucleotide 2'-phosphodiesterase/3'-nucleotidase
MKSTLRVLFFFTLVIYLTGCSSGTGKIKIIVTTDVHGSFFPTDIKTGEVLPLSMARVQSLVSEEKKKKGQKVILLDNGDIIQGDPFVYYYNFEKTDEPHIVAQILDFMGYDAATVGNHDVEAGHEVYDKLVSDSGFPWLAANAVRTDNGEPYFRPYTIIKRGGVKVAVLGLITPAIPSWLPPQIWSGMEFDDMVESADKWVKIIIEKEKPDLLVGLFHSGMDFTYNHQDENTPRNENAVKLVAQKVPGFDIIFCGHDHRTWNQRVMNPEGEEVLILGSRSKASEVAIAEVEVAGKRGNIAVEIKGTNQPVGNFPPDSLYMEKFADAWAAVREYVARPLGRIKNTISTREAFFGPSAFIDLIHTVQLEISGAEISFAAPLSFDTRINEGEITVGDMFDLYRYENLLYSIEMSGKEIAGYLNYSYGGWFSTMSSTSDHLINFSEDDSGRFRTARAYYNFDSALGIIYQVDVSKPSGQMVKVISMADGSDFEEERNYLVAVNSYRGNGGGGHLTEGAGIPPEELQSRIKGSTDKDLRYYMMKWIEKKQVIDPKPAYQWTVIPEVLVKAGRERDYPILFRN